MTMPKQLLIRAAARNNAEWCAAMSRSHGLAPWGGTSSQPHSSIPDEEHPQRAEPVHDRRGGHSRLVLAGPGRQPRL
jgi:hypothetical protein